MTINKYTQEQWSWWGFTQADGSFIVTFNKKNKGRLPYQVQPIFILYQNIREIAIIQNIQKKLGVGGLYKNRNDVNFTVTSITHLLNVIIPHFDGGKLIFILFFVQLLCKWNKKNI